MSKIYDEAESSVQNLKPLKVEKRSYGSLHAPMLNEKLPNGICFNLACRFKDDVWKLDGLLMFFKTEIEAKERSISIGFLTDSFESKSHKNSHQSYSA